MAKLISAKSISFIVVITLFYLLVSIYLMNPTLISTTIIGNYDLSFKVKLLLALIEGMWTAMPHVTLLLLFMTGILTGLNASLLLQKMKMNGGVRKKIILVGGSSLLGIAGAGCTACGLPILALFGLTGSLAFLPFQGQELLFLSVSLLLFSLVILVKSMHTTPSCSVASAISR
jgi:hypothetical protein